MKILKNSIFVLISLLSCSVIPVVNFASSYFRKLADAYFVTDMVLSQKYLLVSTQLKSEGLLLVLMLISSLIPLFFVYTNLKSKDLKFSGYVSLVIFILQLVLICLAGYIWYFGRWTIY